MIIFIHRNDMIDILSGKPFARVMYSKHAWRDMCCFSIL